MIPPAMKDKSSNFSENTDYSIRDTSIMNTINSRNNLPKFTSILPEPASRVF
jgi:hypothetical protein